MSLIVFGLLAAAAAAGLGGVVARRVAKRRRENEARAALPAAEPPPPSPFEQLPIRIGDVVQHGDATRWPSAAVLVRHDGQAHCGVFLSVEQGKRQATIAFAPPRHELLWLEQTELELPPSPPSRIEVFGQLLDRRALLFVELDVEGKDAPDIAGSATLALYASAMGEAAAVLVAAQLAYVFCGRQLAPDDYEVLGRVSNDG